MLRGLMLDFLVESIADPSVTTFLARGETAHADVWPLGASGVKGVSDRSRELAPVSLWPGSAMPERSLTVNL